MLRRSRVRYLAVVAAFGAVLSVAGLAAPTARAADGNAVVLKFATVDTPYAEVNIHIHHPWAARVSEARGGALRIQVEDGAGTATFENVYQRVLDDQVQIGWALQPPDKFPLTQVASLPLVAPTAQAASVALYRLWKSGALDSEYREIEPLKLCITSESGLHLRAVPSSNAGVAGLKIIEAGKIGGDTIAALGGTPVTLAIDRYRPALAQGSADGVLAGWPIFEPLELHAVTKFHVDVPLGGAPCMVFMAKKRYLALSAAARRALDARSREHETSMLGRFWDTAAQEGRFEVAGRKGQVVVSPSKEQLASFRERVAPAVDAWVRRTPGGAAILARFKAELAELAADR